MGLISRLYDFVAGTPIVADQVDAEFNQILGVLNGGIDSSNITDGSIAVADLATATKNNFPKLASVADVKMAFGTGTVTFPNSTDSNNVTVPHGLGKTPVAVAAMGEGIDGGWRILSKDATNVVLQLIHYSGTVNASFTFDWMAIG